MDVDFLLAHCPGLKLTRLAQREHDQQLILTVVSTTPTALCPLCQTASGHIHCYYPRTLQDRSCSGLNVHLQIRARRFVCSNAQCPRRTFAERLGEQIPAYARRTKQCNAWLQAIGLALGGRAGARLAKIVSLPVSSDTLLRLVRAVGVAEPERPPPQVLGIDDFALRKGQKYATILVDLERQHLVDLLPDREKGTVVAWLKAHPGVKVVSRDRGGAYAEAVREATPQAIQVADRFHLAQNLGETVERVLRRYSPTIQKIFGEARQTPQVTQPNDQSLPRFPLPLPPLPLLRHEADKQVSQLRRMTVYEHVKSLAEQGYSQTEIAEQLLMSRKKVRQLLKEPPQPPIYKQRSTKIAPYKPYLKHRFAEEGCANSLQLYREICAQGYDGCRSVVTNYVTQLRQQAGLPAQTGKHTTRQPKPFRENIPAPSQIRWWFLLPVERLSAKQQGQLTQLCQCAHACVDLCATHQSNAPEVGQAQEVHQSEADFALLYQLAQAFIALLHEHTDAGLTEWLAQVQRSCVPELLSFAGGLNRDEAAVRAGLRLKWSQGPVEGAVNRVKLIKRSMYGRANFDLLRTRVLCAA